MSTIPASVLVTDDDPINRKMLSRLLQREGHRVETADNGKKAMEKLMTTAFDIVLLDIMMPEMDGYEVLERIKRDERLRYLPVIMISAVEEMNSVVRCIELGAEDHLTKPFDPVLLRARINAGLMKKRLHDLELEYMEQVGHVMDAAAAIEERAYDPRVLDEVATRPDALGQLARVFQRMAQEVLERERLLKQQVQRLRIEIDETRAARQVEEITSSEYFRELQTKAAKLRLSPEPEQ